MATRLSFRPRPVDINKQLNIVRDLSELDTNPANPADGAASDAEAILQVCPPAPQPP